MPGKMSRTTDSISAALVAVHGIPLIEKLMCRYALRTSQHFFDAVTNQPTTLIEIKPNLKVLPDDRDQLRIGNFCEYQAPTLIARLMCNPLGIQDRKNPLRPHPHRNSLRGAPLNLFHR